MAWLLLVPLLYVVAVVQTSLVDLIQVGRATPDLFALVAVMWIVLVPGRRSFLVAGLIGLVEDLFAPGCLGPAAASYLVVGYGLTQLRQRLAFESLALRIVLTAIAVTVIAFALSMAALLLGEASIAWKILIARSAEVGLYTAGVSIPCWMVAGWWSEPRRSNRKETEGMSRDGRRKTAAEAFHGKTMVGSDRPDVVGLVRLERRLQGRDEEAGA